MGLLQVAAACLFSSFMVVGSNPTASPNRCVLSYKWLASLVGVSESLWLTEL